MVTGVLAAVAFSVFIAYVAFAIGRVSTVPGSTDFWKTFGAPIAYFATALATIFVGLVAFFGAVYASFRQEKSNEATRTQTAADNEATRRQTAADNEASRMQTARDEELGRCWDRFTWLVDRFSGSTGQGEEPGQPGPREAATAAELFPADIVVEIAISLEADAERLSDETLAKALRLYHQTLGNQF
ncbi:hypothetical protein A5660_15025 [Mycobacterium alsense]|uniref:hypothetical protein n=1 Tax=Mycobacterium alsense TaxID=324058 RepID=UPI0007FDA49F|nr:hypothetical protein [Mycobacterium alsense]OBJ06019.1 hypothetical protein A5660_15025 [Mycobacterium alsense]